MAISPGASEHAGFGQAFDDFVQSTIQDWRVPGCAVAVVKDGDVTLARGYGLRDVAAGLSVTPNTLFAIGSCTKAFTTLGMGILADDGMLDWDAPVKTYLPTFRMYDSFATERMTPRDLVTHRSGLPRHDLLWYGAARSRQELFDRLQYLEPSQDFRTVWQYQNLMYMAAGYLVGQIAGRSWEEFTEARILRPLGMESTNFSVTRSQVVSDFAHPYGEDGNGVKEIPFRNIDAIGPAGSINSNVVEMARWLLLHLNKGARGDVRIVSEGQITQMHSPQMVVPEPRKYGELSHASYGLGWATQQYRGRSVILHGGGIDGFASVAMLLPEKHAGVVVLTNRGGHPVPTILGFNVLDRVLGLDEIPWSERFRKEQAELKQAGERAKEKRQADRVPATRPSHSLDSYCGVFAHPAYDTVVIERADDQLKATFNSLTCPLTHYHYDVFEMTWGPWDARLTVAFTTNARGEIDSLAIPLEPMVKDIVFARAPDKELTETAFLRKFVGQYDAPGMALSVSLKGERALLISMPGQPVVELTPIAGTRFAARGLSGYDVEFTCDADGMVVDAVVTQPFGVFTARRRGI